jgi:amino acid transporter
VPGKITFNGSFMQSFTSVGPMLDVAALFSAIALYSGTFIGLVMVIAFGITFTTMYVVYSLSSRFQSNGGYYFFTGKILGKGPGVAISLIYVVYAMLVIPDISFFVSYFTLSYVNSFSFLAEIWVYAVPLVFLLCVVGIVSLGIGRSIKYTIAAGSLELLFLLILDILFFSKGQPLAFPIIPKTETGLLSVFSGVVFGVLAFSGNGSSIFLSEDTVNGIKTVPKGITYSYVVTGVMLILSAFALTSFLGVAGIASYSSSPFFVVISIRKTLGTVVYLIFGIMAIVSATNLSVSYGNALFNAMRKMTVHYIFPNIGLGPKKMLILFVLVEGVIIETSTFFYGSVTAFIIVAAIVSFSYMIVHIVAGISLVKLSAITRKFRGMIPAILSTLILSTTFVFSVVADSSSGLPGLVSIIVVAVMAAMVLLITVVGVSVSPRWYSRITFSEN